MATFGSFETVQEVYYGPTYAVYSARKSGDPKTEYAIKVFFLLPANLATESEGKAAPMLDDIRGSYLDRVSLQQKAAAASKFVAPILETGHDERGVWYATRFYGRSVNKMMNGRLAPTRQSLQHILGGLAHGALDLKRVCGRSHGEILPTNIQISRSENILDAEVVLSDPLPGNPSDAARYELADLRSIGQILLHLVLRRLISPEDDYLILPILSSPEWTQVFGKDADRWLALCNRLLDPNLSLDQYSLAQLVAELEEIKPKSRVPVKLILATASALVALAIGAVVVQKQRQLQAVEITSDPAGATILMGQKEAGKTPLSLKLAPGPHALEARQDALRLSAQSTNWVIQPGTPPKLHFQFPYGSLAIKSIPPGATVTRDGVSIGTTPADGSPLIIPALAPGPIQYQFNLDGHEPTNVTVGVTAQQRLVLSATLRPVAAKDTTVPVQKITEPTAPRSTAPVRVALESEPAGATVWIGTTLLGTTPTADVLRPAGSNTFRFELSGFETTNVTVVIPENAALPQKFKAVLTTTSGHLELSTDPAEATIVDANGKELGRTAPGKPLKMPVGSGSHTFTAKVEGLADVTETLNVEKREFKKHTIAFDYGTVRIVSQPPGASVAVGGKNIARTPLQRIQRPGAKVAYQIVASDYLPKTQEVIVRSRETNSSFVILEPEPVRVAFSSNPEGAQFYAQGKLLGDSLPWGTNTIIAKQARYPWMEDVTNVVMVRKGAANTHEFTFNFSRVEFATTPAGVDIYERGTLIARSPTNLYVRPGRVDYELVLGSRTNRVGTNLPPRAAHRFSAVFELKRNYTNSFGMELVRVPDGFYVGRFEVTEEQYQRVMMGNAAKKSTLPKVDISWSDAVAFCQKLSQMDAASLGNAWIASWNYSLPTEREWMGFVEDDPNQIKEAVFSTNPQPALASGRDDPATRPMDKPRSPGTSFGSGPTRFPKLLQGAQGAQGPKEIDFLRNSFNRSAIYDLFGNVAEWGYGADDRPMTTGGSFMSKPVPWKFPPTSAMIDRSPPIKGADHIGIRCVLKPPIQ